MSEHIPALCHFYYSLTYLFMCVTLPSSYPLTAQSSRSPLTACPSSYLSTILDSSYHLSALSSSLCLSLPHHSHRSFCATIIPRHSKMSVRYHVTVYPLDYSLGSLTCLTIVCPLGYYIVSPLCSLLTLT